VLFYADATRCPPINLSQVRLRSGVATSPQKWTDLLRVHRAPAAHLPGSRLAETSARSSQEKQALQRFSSWCGEPQRLLNPPLTWFGNSPMCISREARCDLVHRLRARPDFCGTRWTCVLRALAIQSDGYRCLLNHEGAGGASLSFCNGGGSHVAMEPFFTAAHLC
jgi:hypothetical protein